MNILARYLLRNFLTMLALTLPGVAGIYLIIEAAEKLNSIIGAGASLQTGALYFLLILPKIIFELTPMAVMLSGLLAVMLLSRHGEIIAMRSVGINISKIIRYFLLFAASVSIVTLAAQAFFIPKATEAADILWQTAIKKEPLKGMFKGDRLFYHGEGDIWTAGLASPDAKVLQDVYIIKFDDDYTVTEVIGAHKAEYLNGVWVFSNGFTKTMTQQKWGGLMVKTFTSHGIKLSERPEDFVAIQKSPLKMDMVSLWKNIQRLRQSGYAANEQETALWSQAAYPFLGITLLWLGLPLIIQKERGGMALGLGIGMVFGFTALALWKFFITLGMTSTLPPFVSAMMTHILFGGAGFIAFKKLKG
ncbi:MAG: LptF/LptG family permease [Dissulfurimicrobium sp.]|uniref:LptF/LptG family permease n=1 Tax=Dissulfurimicrobium sp. TaxID=2022436 RepID=UPI004049CACF